MSECSEMKKKGPSKMNLFVAIDIDESSFNKEICFVINFCCAV